MNKRIISALALAILSCSASFAQQSRALSDVMKDVEKRFNVRLKYNVDTVGKRLPHADFRIRPYSIEETLDNICKYLTSIGGNSPAIHTKSSLMSICAVIRRMAKDADMAVFPI